MESKTESKTKFTKIDSEGNQTVADYMTLEEVKKFCGGYVTVMSAVLDDRKHVIIYNEEGQIHKLPVNKKFPFLVGNVIVTDSEEWV